MVLATFINTIPFNPTMVKSEKQRLHLEKLNFLQGKGKDNHNWKGGKRTDGYGYVQIYKGNQKYKAEHILIMEKHLGRKLKSNEVIHHINGIRKDNRIENLIVMIRSKHISKHQKGVKEKLTKKQRENLSNKAKSRNQQRDNKGRWLKSSCA